MFFCYLLVVEFIIHGFIYIYIIKSQNAPIHIRVKDKLKKLY